MANKKDYSQDGDPYGIEEEYSSQSAEVNLPVKPKSAVPTGAADIRGNTATGARSIPTQAEVDAITGYKRPHPLAG